MPTETHGFELARSFMFDGVRAACSCGWESSQVHDDEDGAIEDWENHCDAVFIEATTSGE